MSDGKRINIHVSDEEHIRLKTQASALGLSIKDLVLSAVNLRASKSLKNSKSRVSASQNFLPSKKVRT